MQVSTAVNQAVVFTKPVHHLGISLTPEELDERARSFLEAKGLTIVFSRKITGSELARRNVIKQHYLMYSKAACAEAVEITESGMAKFEAAFGRKWRAEVDAGRILPTSRLLESRRIDVHQLFDLWNDQYMVRGTQKIQTGLVMAWLEELDAYCINAFYPAMEANFCNPETRISYYVVEFDPEQVSWLEFRKRVLGLTDASEACPESFRGQLYAQYPLDFPGRDNFVHGSAGPLEGLVERSIHEADFDMAGNPIGNYLLGRGVTLDRFRDWKSKQSISVLGELFDATEEKNTDEVFQTLELFLPTIGKPTLR
ncbi:MAG: hypothetical protein JEZ10_05820 [Verrucomicrobia bacterium]|nr:hypothetical protein [Verrucomicrobiota bacterium]